MTEPGVPEQIGPYRILRKIGQGGMGLVLVAEDTRLERRVALKLVRPEGLFGEQPIDSQRLARFEREIRETAHLNDPGHPGIVRIYDAGVANGLPYYTMELIRGRSLSELIPAHGMPLEVACRILRLLADGVHYAHTHPGGGVLHRDIKPDNVMIDESGAPHLLDFGLAKGLSAEADDGGSQATRGIAGTLSYMAPEQATPGQPLGPTADVYGLGATFYHMLTGRPPFQGASSAELLAHVVLHSPEPPTALRRDIPPELAAICMRTLAKRPASRYASARELADDVERFARGWRTIARQPAWWERLAVALLRHRVKALLLLLLLAGFTLAAALVNRRTRRQEWRYRTRLSHLRTRIMLARASAPASHATYQELRRLALHLPADPEVAAALNESRGLLAGRYASEAGKLTREAVARIDAGDLWLAAWMLARAQARQAWSGRTYPPLEQAWRRLEQTRAQTVLHQGQRVEADTLQRTGHRSYRGWYFTREQARLVQLIRTPRGLAREDDLVADGWIPAGRTWVPSALAARKAGLVSSKALSVPWAAPVEVWLAKEQLHSARIYLHDQRWRPEEALLRLGLVKLREHWTERLALADAGRLVKHAGRHWTAVELARAGYLEHRGAWHRWQELVGARQARLASDSARPGRPFRFEVDPQTLMTSVTWADEK